MKKFLLLVLATIAVVGTTYSQDQSFLMQTMPVDDQLRTGTLPNGMHYYIRHNEKPKGQADFFIVSAVGAIQEDDNQQGLAHFLEHMAFNGTKNYPGKGIMEMCERNGVKFGANLNASTSFDVTQYLMTNVPVSDALEDSMLLVLHDWSHFISLEGDEIDAERGVIKEELRTRDNSSWRSSLHLIQTLGMGSKYEHRNIIGHLDGLSTFEHESLRNFYKTWYRPDNQAVIVVGDIDVNKMEQKIKDLMSDIPASDPNAPQKEVYVIPDNEEPIVSVFSDPEMQYTYAMLVFKHPALNKEMRSTVYGEMRSIILSYISSMLNERFAEMAQKPEAPFLSAAFSQAFFGNIIPSLDKYAFQVVTADGKLNAGFEAVYKEMERVKRFGFTTGEYERTKTELLSSSNSAYNNRNDLTNSSYVNEYISNFTTNSPIYSDEYEWQLDSLLLNEIDLTAINAFCKEIFTDNNQVVIVNCPEKEGVTTPVAEEIEGLMATVRSADIEPYADNTVKEPLIAAGTKLKGSPVAKTTTEPSSGATEWTLKNGTKIVVMPTKNKADEITLDAMAMGGMSLIANDKYYTAKLLPELAAQSGVSKFTATELRKQLAGINASESVYINNYSHGISATSTPKDLESMLQLVYLQFTAPRLSEDDFATLMTQYRAALANMESNPDFIAAQRFVKDVYGDNYRRQQLSNALLDDVKFDDAQSVFETLFPGTKGFTFTFVGNVDLETLKPLVEKYIGSIPAGKTRLNFIDDKVRPVQGVTTDDFKAKMQQPKVGVYMSFSGDIDYTIKNGLTTSFLAQILRTRYTASIREEKGGTYGVSVSGSLSKTPVAMYFYQIIFDTNTQMVDELIPIAYEEIEKIATDGPDAKDFNAVKEYMLKNWKVALQDNSSYTEYLNILYHKGLNYFRDYEKELNALSGEDIKVMAAKLLDKSDNHSTTIMRPEE